MLHCFSVGAPSFLGAWPSLQNCNCVKDKESLPHTLEHFPAWTLPLIIMLPSLSSQMSAWHIRAAENKQNFNYKGPNWITKSKRGRMLQFLSLDSTKGPPPCLAMFHPDVSWSKKLLGCGECISGSQRDSLSSSQNFHGTVSKMEQRNAHMVLPTVSHQPNSCAFASHPKDSKIAGVTICHGVQKARRPVGTSRSPTLQREILDFTGYCCQARSGLYLMSVKGCMSSALVESCS